MKKFLLLLALVGCVGTGELTITGGLADGDSFPTSLTVSALYPNFGENWLDYIETGSDTDCNSADTTACVNGGPYRKVEVTGVSSCSGLSMVDSETFFTWTCDDSGGTATFTTSGMPAGKYLSDLLDTATTDFKTMSVTLTSSLVSLSSTATKWWSNTVTALPDNDNDGSYIIDGTAAGTNDAVFTSGTIFMVNSNMSTNGFEIDLDKIAVVVMPGITLSADTATGVVNYLDVSTGASGGASDGFAVFTSQNNSFIYYEGDIDTNTGEEYAVVSFGGKNVELHNGTIQNGTTGTILANGTTYYTLKNVDLVSSAAFTGSNALESTNYAVFDTVSLGNYLNALTINNSDNASITSISSTATQNVIFLNITGTSANNTFTSIDAGTAGFFTGGFYLIGSGTGNRLNGYTSKAVSGGASIWAVRVSSNSNIIENVNVSGDSSGTSCAGALTVVGSNNSIKNVTASGCVRKGVTVTGSENSFTNIVVSNTKGPYANGFGIDITNGDSNKFTNVLLHHNEAVGIKLQDADKNVFQHVTTMGSDNYGVLIDGSSVNNIFSQVVATGGGRELFINSAGGASGNMFYDSAWTLSLNGIQAETGTLTEFHGTQFFYGNQNQDCTGGVTAGITGACAAEGSSTHAVENLSDTISSFIGSVSSDDTANAADTNGLAAYTGTTDISFDNLYRGWGLDGSFASAYNAAIQGNCESGNCRIWDFSVSSSDIEYRNQFGCPAGSTTLLYDGTVDTNFVRYAYEYVDFDDGVGDDDGLCESGETCIYAPNLGAYQGHGTLAASGSCADIGTGGTVTNVTMMEYPTNGR